MPITITEGLAEIRTITKRIVSKRLSIVPYLTRQEGLKDPLEKNGGSPAVIAREMQAIKDLEDRIVAIRCAIQSANDATTVEINGMARTISQWIIWRRDIAPDLKSHLSLHRQTLASVRQTAIRQGNAVVTNADKAAKPTDFIINIDEGELAKAIEDMENTLGTLDGQLSLKNATVLINV